MTYTKLLLSFFLILFVFHSFSQEKAPSTLRYSDHIRGGVATLANTSLIDVNKPSPNLTFPYNNNGRTAGYLDDDNDNSTFSSSSYTINGISQCAKVVHAILYWAGAYPYAKGNVDAGGDFYVEDSQRDDPANIKIKLPGTGEVYQDITGTEIYDAYKEVFTGGIQTQPYFEYAPYVYYADITDKVQNITDPNGTYWVANVRGTIGRGVARQRSDLTYSVVLGTEAGWIMLIVYEDPAVANTTEVNIFDGFFDVVDNSSLTTTFSGFHTPATGPVEIELLVGALEGDGGGFFTGDQIEITSSTSSTVLGGGINPTNDFFNGTISRDGAHDATDGIGGSPVPASTAYLGFDFDVLHVSNPGNTLIGNGETSIDVKTSTSGDTFGTFLMGIDLSVTSPYIRVIKSVEDNTGTALAHESTIGNNTSEPLKYILTIENLGDAIAENVVISGTIPNELTIDETTLPSSATYNSTTRELKFDYSTISHTAASFQENFNATADKTCSTYNIAIDFIVSYENTTYNVDKDDAPTLIFTTEFVCSPLQLTYTNSCPSASDNNFTVNEDSSNNLFPVLSSGTPDDFGTDGASSSAITITTAPKHGTASVKDNGTPNDPTDDEIEYSPDANYNGLDSLTYQICDADINCDEAKVRITITALNDAPVISATDKSIPEGTTAVETVTATDADTGDTKTFSITGGDDAALFEIDPVTGELSFKTAPDFENPTDNGANNVYDVTVTVTDGTNLSDSETIAVTVTGVNDNSPVITATDKTMEEGITAVETITATDADAGDTKTFSITGGADAALFEIDPVTGELSFKTAPDFENPTDNGANNVYDVTVTVTDGADQADSKAIAITIVKTNTPPDAVNDSAQVEEDNTLNGSTLLGNDSDPEGDNLTINTIPVVDVQNGQLTINTDGTYTYIPDPNFNGTDSFTYQVCDDGTPQLCSQATVNITVNAANDAPVATDDSAQTDEDNTLNGNNLLGNDSDPDGDNLTINTIPVANVQNGQLTINTDGTYTYIPDPNFNGTDSFTYQVCDDGTPQLCSQATVSITVNEVNEPPVAEDDSAQVGEDGTLHGSSLLNNDNDPDGNYITIKITPVVDVQHGQLTIHPDGTYTYIPAPGFYGTDSFTYEICDDGTPQQCSQATVEITVDFTGLFIPDAFTPNSDFFNDYFKIKGIENYPDNKLEIFNRWGTMVFKMKGYDNSWNGYGNVSGRVSKDRLPIGTYYYVLYLDKDTSPVTGYIYMTY